MMREDQEGIDLYWSIPHASLDFLPRDHRYEASYEAVIRLYDERGKDLLKEIALIDSVQVISLEETRDFWAHSQQHRLKVDEGDYLVEVTLTDRESGEQAQRRQVVEVVDGESSRPVLSRIRLEAKRTGQPFAPAIALFISEEVDSLRAAFDVFNVGNLEKLKATIRLLQFPSDTLAALPPYAFSISDYGRLIQYKKADTLLIESSVANNPADEVALIIGLPPLDEGMYRVEVEIREATASGNRGEASLTEQRDFAVRRASFPHVESFDLMVDALVYLATKKEYREILDAPDELEQKRRFDAFWGALMPVREQAADLLEQYYSRVEEANLRYTTYKEGWKTDRGMVYILLGDPIYVDTQVDVEMWFYRYSDEGGSIPFVFERRRLYQSGGMYESYLLIRQPEHDRSWRRALRRWRSGSVL